MWKKIVLLLLVVVFCCCGCGKKKDDNVNTLDVIKSRGKVYIGVRTDTYPFGFLDKKGRYAGFDVELAKIIGRKIFEKDGCVKFVNVNASDRMMKLYSEDIDMIIATMSVTKNRAQILDFSNPYFVAGQSMLVRKNSPVKSLRDLQGKKAIIVFGSTSEQSLRGAVPNLGIIGYRTYKEAYNALKQGKADAIVSDDTILMGYALKDTSVELLPKRFSKEPYAVAFKKGPESEGLIHSVNTVIAEETRNGNLKRVLESYGIK